MSTAYHTLSHTKWDCKYHVIFIPKYCKKVLFGKMRPWLGSVFHALANQKESKIVEGHLMSDHVHMCIDIPPKYPVSSVIGFLKGKSTIAIARQQGTTRHFNGESFWARGYTVFTLGFKLSVILKYIREQEGFDEVTEGLF